MIEESNIAVIDLDSVIFTAFHPNKKLDEKGVPIRDNNKFVYVEKTEDEIKDCCDSLMHLILSSSKATHYIGFVKGVDTIKARTSINPNYKANRSKESPQHWNFCKNYLISNWGAIACDNAEVDDYVNATRLNLKGAYLVAIDGDLLGLETFEKDHYNWRTFKWITVTKEEASHKFWFDMIKGQTVDNIKGIKGIGEVGANKILDGSTFPAARVLKNYIMVYGEQLGIDEYYKNYKSLKILDNWDGFVIPKPIEYKKIDKEENNKYKIEF